MGRLGIFVDDNNNPYAWSTEPMPAPPHPAVTPLDTTYWRLTPVAWDSERFHAIVSAWMADPTHLRALLTERPSWCQSARPCDYAVANLFDKCLNPRPCVGIFRPAAVTYVARCTSVPRRRRVDTMSPGQFASAAMRVLLPHVLRACRAVSQVRVPVTVCGVRGVWIGASCAAIERRDAPIVAAWDDDDRGPVAVTEAADVVRDLEAPAGGGRVWMDVLCGDAGDASAEAKRAAKAARADVIRALQRAPPRREDLFRDI